MAWSLMGVIGTLNNNNNNDDDDDDDDDEVFLQCHIHQLMALNNTLQGEFGQTVLSSLQCLNLSEQPSNSDLSNLFHIPQA